MRLTLMQLPLSCTSDTADLLCDSILVANSELVLPQLYTSRLIILFDFPYSHAHAFSALDVTMSIDVELQARTPSRSPGVMLIFSFSPPLYPPADIPTNGVHPVEYDHHPDLFVKVR